jgi:hypothetical protein
VFAPETVTLLESGCALIVAAVDTDGAPRAARGWSLTVVGPDEVRLILQGDDPVTEEYLLASRRIAITAASVITLLSIQCKGEVLAIEPVTKLDDERIARYCDAFYHDVGVSDGVPRELLERMTPVTYVACRVRVHECFNQTPGPGAGSPLAAETP